MERPQGSEVFCAGRASPRATRGSRLRVQSRKAQASKDFRFAIPL
jgi:hypothetical protein